MVLAVDEGLAAEPLLLDPEAPALALGADAPVGLAKPMTLPVRGPGAAEAEAPTPTRPPSPCCTSAKIR